LSNIFTQARRLKPSLIKTLSLPLLLHPLDALYQQWSSLDARNVRYNNWDTHGGKSNLPRLLYQRGEMMQRTFRTNKNCGQIIIKPVALSLLLCIVIIPLLTTVFMITLADHDCHDCIGESCSVCALIHKAQKLLERIDKAAVVMLTVAVSLFTAITIWSKFDFLFRPCHLNLVSAKIRLNN